MNFLINIILDLLFPRRCPVCGQIVMPKGSLICPGCVKKLSWVRGPVCKCCGKEGQWNTVPTAQPIQDHFPMEWRFLTTMKYQPRPWQWSNTTTAGNIWISMQKQHTEDMLNPLPGCHRT